jgi:hypothetical protein
VFFKQGGPNAPGRNMPCRAKPISASKPMKNKKFKPKTKPKADTLTAEQLCTLTTLTDRRHRQIATEGFFPAPKRGRYERDATLSGLFRYFRELASKESDEERQAKTKLANARADAITRASELGDGAIVSFTWADRQVAEAFAEASGWFAGRMDHLCELVGKQAIDEAGRKEIRMLLEGDLQTLRISMVHVETRIRQAFRNGELENTDNILRDFDAELKGLADKLTPAARDELLAALK